MTDAKSPSWKQYQGDGKVRPIKKLPDAPGWRQFERRSALVQQMEKGERFRPPEAAIEMVNAAISLRRPLLITGNPGTGKSSLPYAVARELGLLPVLKWAITTRTTLRDGLYSYDAIARLQDAQLADRQGAVQQPIGEYITLGPLGTAFLPSASPSALPKVLLIDEIDKSDIDLPNDLLNLFEDGEFPIPELQRLSDGSVQVRRFDRDEKNEQLKAAVENGVVRCTQFPLVIMTSNGERDFPAPFLRRCLRLRMPDPTPETLRDIVTSQFDAATAAKANDLIQSFCDRLGKKAILATDQLLNVIHMRLLENSADGRSLTDLEARLLRDLEAPGDE
ncbi:MAG: hypothetical protein RLZZ511_3429 [Cyanobacteriota bacterium]|jgi:MoxR-like ATPase